MLGRVTLSLALAGLVSAASWAQAPAPKSDEELRSHLETLARRADDATLDVGIRERLAVEMASTLDRAASTAPTNDQRRAHWSEAADVLRKFTAKVPDHPQAGAFQVQAAVYLWAKARTWLQAYRANPADAKARATAAAELEACVRALRPVRASVGKDAEAFAQNARFRTAQALADLDEATDGDAEAHRALRAEALEALDPPTTEPGLSGFALLLKGVVLARLGRPDEARAAIDAAAKAKTPPPPVEVLDARLTALLAGKQFEPALKAVEAAGIDAGLKPVMRARVRLEQREEAAEGPGRDAVETALFADLKAIRASSRPEARPTLLTAARSIREPSKGQPPEAWDVLAAGAEYLGDPARAAELERGAGDRAEASNQPERAAEYRLRAGAYFYQAEKFAEADPLLTRVARDPKAGASRPRAGLLRALARGRALALNRPGASQADYAAALRDQIKAFPDDPSASEARWLLGKFRLAENDRDGALALWKAIPHGSPRWLDARVEIADARQHDLDTQRLNNDREAVTKKFEDAQKDLAGAIAQARGDGETGELLLSNARLELTPGVGHPDEALNFLERVQRSAPRASQRDAARRLNVVALAQLNRWVEAEQLTRIESRSSEAVDLLPVVRLLDRTAAEAESDLRSRRIGLLLRILLDRVLDQADALGAEQKAETKLRYVRALQFSGDEAGARRAVNSAPLASKNASVELLRDLAETYMRLEAYPITVDVQRLRAKLAPTGSLSWFDARYGMALAYYRSGKPKDALQIIDATAILHPDLGGGDLRDRFIRLRQRINPTG